MTTVSSGTPTTIHDSDIRRQIWQGSIPIVFNIASHEVTSLQAPHPLYVMVPRHSYLTLYIDVVREHFEPFVSNFNKDDVWVEYENIPLKWNIPLGVLFDFSMLQREQLNSSSASITGYQNRILRKEIPWRLTVHFHSFPDREVIRIRSDNDIQWNYLNSLKEAFYVKYSNTKPILTLNKQDQTKLWQSIKDARLFEYEEVQQLLQQSVNNVRNFPIRLITVNRTEVKQKLYCIDANSNEIQTLGDFIQMVTREQMEPDAQNGNLNTQNIVIQGIFPALDTNLQWLVNNLSHPDHFLYICIEKQQS